MTIAATGVVPAEATVDAGLFSRLDGLRVTWLHLAIVAVASLGFAFDLLEVALGNVLSAVFSQGASATEPVKLSWLLAAMYVGAVIGAPSAGWLADRIGRKLVLVAILAVLSVTSLSAAFSPGIDTLIVSRLLSGLALGAYPPLVIAYLTDILPSRRRGLLIMVASALAALGPVLMIFFVRWLTPLQPLGLEAWRWAFIVGTAGAAATAILFALFLPESPRWLAAKGRSREAETQLQRFERSRAVGTADDRRPTTTTPRELRPPTAFDGRKPFVPMALLSFLGPWSMVAFPVLMGAVLIEKGFQLSDTLLYVGISTFGPVVGTLLAATFLDRLDRRLAVALWAGGMLLSGAAFAWSFNPLWLMTSGIIFYTFASLQAPTLSIYAAESFPTGTRAGTTSLLWAVNRIASAVGLLVLVPLLKTAGVWPMVTLILGSLALVIIAVLWLGPEGRNRRAVD